MRRVQPVSDILFHKFGNEGLILHIPTETYFRLNGTGIEMWELLNETGEIDQVLQKLLQKYNINHEELAADLDEFVRKLAKRGLITLHE